MFVRYPDARLSQKAAPRQLDDDLRAVGARLLAAQIEAQSFGLAAAHIGEVEPVVIINFGGSVVRQDTLWFNPKIVAVAKENAAGTEGSVSLPGAEAQILRPVWAEFAYEDVGGATLTARHEGFAARVALHEIEQMNGRFFLDNLSRLKRDMVLKKFAKAARSQ